MTEQAPERDLRLAVINLTKGRRQPIVMFVPTGYRWPSYPGEQVVPEITDAFDSALTPELPNDGRAAVITAVAQRAINASVPTAAILNSYTWAQHRRLFNSPLEQQVGPSVLAAFNWLFRAEAFADGPVADAEARALEIGNVYGYALAEGLDEALIDTLCEAAR